jgi:hypothetical protein
MASTRAENGSRPITKKAIERRPRGGRRIKTRNKTLESSIRHIGDGTGQRS